MFYIWLEYRSLGQHQQRIEINHLCISLVDQNGLELQPSRRNDEIESKDKFFDKDKTYIDGKKADAIFLEADWSRFLSPEGQLRIRCRFGIAIGQDFWTKNQHEGSSVTENLAEQWNSGDFTDATLVNYEYLNSGNLVSF